MMTHCKKSIPDIDYAECMKNLSLSNSHHPITQTGVTIRNKSDVCTHMKHHITLVKILYIWLV